MSRVADLSREPPYLEGITLRVKPVLAVCALVVLRAEISPV